MTTKAIKSIKPAKKAESAPKMPSITEVIDYIKQEKNLKTNDDAINFALRYTSKSIATQRFLEQAGENTL
jgi:hypothetical protein